MTRKLTVGLLLDDTLDRSDGVQQAVLAIGKELSLRGHSVHYIVPKTIRTDLPNIHSIGKFASVNFNGNSVRTPFPASKKTIKKLFREVSFDVLHVQMPYSPFLASRVLAMAPKNVLKIGTFHILPYNFLSTYGTKLLGTIMKKSISNLDTCVAVSRPAKEFMDTSFGVNGIIIPNPVDYKFFNSYTKNKQNIKQIVYIGRFELRKGVLELVKAYGMIGRDIRSKTKLIMCGNGPFLKQAKSLADELKLDIHFPGFVSDEEKAQYLADADIAVFPSISGESFGIVLVEAMSAGAGITIGGNNPGYRSILGQWPDTLFDPKNIQAFSRKLTQFIKIPSDNNAIGASQHEIVKQYDVKKVVDKLLYYYQKT